MSLPVEQTRRLTKPHSGKMLGGLAHKKYIREKSPDHIVSAVMAPNQRFLDENGGIYPGIPHDLTSLRPGNQIKKLSILRARQFQLEC